MKKYLHIDLETIGGFNPKKAIWAAAWIVTDGAGRELWRRAFIIRETVPFLAGDTFWSKRKNGLMIQALADYQTCSAKFFWGCLCADLSECDGWIAFNSRFEHGALLNHQACFKLIDLPASFANEIDLARWAFDALPMSQYAAYALEHGLYSESGKSLSSKCEHLLAWLVASGRVPDSGDHNHLALDDVVTQVAMYQACLATKKRRPAYGERLTHFAHEAWRKWLKLDPTADKTDGARYANA